MLTYVGQVVAEFQGDGEEVGKNLRGTSLVYEM
jgi:hypothetical protein